MTVIYLERREPARNRQRFYTLTRSPDSVWFMDAHSGMGPNRTSRHGPGNRVRNRSRRHRGRRENPPAEGKTRLSRG